METLEVQTQKVTLSHGSMRTWAGSSSQYNIYTYIYLILYIDRGEKTLAKFRYGQTSIGRVCNHMHTRADAADIYIGSQGRKTKRKEKTRAAAFCI